MNIDDLTLGQMKQVHGISAAQSVVSKAPPIFDGPVVAQFIGRFVFVCNLRIEGNYCYLTNVRNVRYWGSRYNGLGGLAAEGKIEEDKIDNWPDQIIPLDKLGPVMLASPSAWS